MFGLIVGTRPSFIMATPIIAAFDQAGAGLKVLHSAQHYSGNMDEVFFRDLGIRAPDHRLSAQPDQRSPAR
jgi:UDP-N-acetylglucosamine 2-epimerase (non-hydrolysing)